MALAPSRRRQEDDVVSAVTEWLRGESWTILASGAVQGSFRVRPPWGGQKAPDIVAVREPALLIGEAKLRAGDLFRPTKAGFSDSDFVIAVVADADTRQQSLQRAGQLAASRGLDVVLTEVEGLLAAASPFRSDLGAGLPLLRVEVLEDCSVAVVN